MSDEESQAGVSERAHLSNEFRGMVAADPRTGLVLDPRFALFFGDQRKLANEAREVLDLRARAMAPHTDALVSVYPRPRLSERALPNTNGELFVLVDAGEGRHVSVPTLVVATILKRGGSADDAAAFTITVESTPTGSTVTAISIAPLHGPLHITEVIPSSSEIDRWKAQAMVEASMMQRIESNDYFFRIEAVDGDASEAVNRLAERRRRSDAPPDELLKLVADLLADGQSAASVRTNPDVVRLNGGKSPHRATVYKWRDRAEEMGL